MELLAPAGSPEALQAAVQAGADAVYLGFGPLNARRNAKNFTREQLEEGVAYCHLRGVKVYLTLNTLLFDRELDTARSLQYLSATFMAASTAPSVREMVVPDMASSISLLTMSAHCWR